MRLPSGCRYRKREDMAKLTRQQIEQMDPAALMLAIAERLGWEDIRVDEDSVMGVDPIRVNLHRRDPFNSYRTPIPDYPNDISIMSQIFEDIPCWQSGKAPNGMYWCEIYNPIVDPIEDMPDTVYCSKTEAEARCKEWLWHKENEK